MTLNVYSIKINVTVAILLIKGNTYICIYIPTV